MHSQEWQSAAAEIVSGNSFFAEESEGERRVNGCFDGVHDIHSCFLQHIL
jgi:hypothetical protein